MSLGGEGGVFPLYFFCYSVQKGREQARLRKTSGSNDGIDIWLRKEINTQKSAILEDIFFS